MSNDNLSISQNNFGEQLRQVRKERKTTLQELGKITRISYGYIGQIERGDREPDDLVKATLEKWMQGGGDVFTPDEAEVLTQEDRELFKKLVKDWSFKEAVKVFCDWPESKRLRFLAEQKELAEAKMKSGS